MNEDHRRRTLWYKKSLRRTIRNPEFHFLSVDAKLTYHTLSDLAGYCDSSGLLINNGEVITAESIVAWTGLPLRKQELSLDELAFKGWIQKRGDGTIEILGWEDDQRGEYGKKKAKQRGDMSPSETPNLWGHVPRKTPKNGETCPPQIALSGGDMSPPKSNIDPFTPFVDKSTHSVKGSPPWVLALDEALPSLTHCELRSLTIEQRFTLAQIHCVRFGNCTKSETRNRARASDVARGFASMSRSQDFGDMRVSEYLAYAGDVHKNRHSMPWFDPWLIKGVVEFEQVER